MAKQMTYEEVFHELTKNIHGDKLFGIVKKRDDGEYKIQPVDVTTMYPITGDGDPELTITTPITLYTSTEGEIHFIEHRYGAFTKVNKEAVERLVSLVGVVVTNLADVEPKCYSTIAEIKEFLSKEK